ncbi:glycoside hydrolase family 97 C-terminal domain-containing protein [Bacteroides ovatus]|nr:glycoside hydrolase family 97 C-terminal domain-containing protein [Bacteroides ovatus]
MASDLPENYKGIKAFDFIKDVPTDWDKTYVVDAKIGDYSVFARKDRNTSDWYVGCITDENAKRARCSFELFGCGLKVYCANIC